ncbi:MAG: SpoIIE family protein phosphatase [Prevotella sp.]|nr:SpoIIE family protein phosphatase [Prevotella sp.]
MVEEPNFEYKYDLSLWKSFSARLSFAILIIAAGVFLAAMLTYLYFSQEQVKEETAVKAQTQLHNAVMKMRLYATETKHNKDSVLIKKFISFLKEVQPYKHSFTLLVDKSGEYIYFSDSVFQKQPYSERQKIIATVNSGQSGMTEVFAGKDLSLLIYEPIGDYGLYAAIVCSRIDILSSYTQLFLYGAVAFIIGLLVLFSCCAFAIYQLVHPLHLFAEAAVSIANGNLDTQLPEIHSEDELLQLRNSFEYMQSSLKQHIEELKITTAGKERLQSELIIAHEIQMGMLPTTFPHRKDLDLYASMIPAKEVGGDLYDFIIDNDELFFIIGDVAGKGVPASLYMAVTRTLFRNLAGNYQSAANVIREINHAIASTNESFIFVTLFVGVLDLKTHHLTYCNAAHNAPVLITEDGNCQLLDVQTNLPVGVEDRFHYEEQQIDFPIGTSLLLYTDGLTEAVDCNRIMFGEERLLQKMRSSHITSAREVIIHLEQAIKDFVGNIEQSDDLTLLYLKHQDDGQRKETKRTIILKNEIAEVSRLKSFLFSVCREQETDESFAFTLNLAMEEAVVNVINYAYPKGMRGHVEITAQVTNYNPDTLSDSASYIKVLTLTIKDSGVPFDPTQTEKIDINAKLGNRPIGGLGIHLVRTIMDTMHYERTTDGQNLLTLTKEIIHQ